MVSKEVLKSSLAKVLTGFPLLASRVTKQSNRAFCPMNGPGPLVYEQHLVVTGAPDTKPLEPVLQKLVRGKVISPNKAPTMILTLTEVGGCRVCPPVFILTPTSFFFLGNDFFPSALVFSWIE